MGNKIVEWIGIWKIVWVKKVWIILAYMCGGVRWDNKMVGYIDVWKVEYTEIFFIDF